MERKERPKQKNGENEIDNPSGIEVGGKDGKSPTGGTLKGLAAFIDIWEELKKGRSRLSARHLARK